MGKSQYPLYLKNNSCTQTNTDMETTEWNICHNLVSNLMACPDKTRLQQKEIFGSPPPRRSANSQWRDEDSENIKINLLSEDSMGKSGNQNNYQTKSSKENSDKNHDRSIQSISNHLRDIHLNPIIVCEAIDDSNNDMSALRQDANELLKLSVPSVDIANEKKRPPISSTKHH